MSRAATGVLLAALVAGVGAVGASGMIGGDDDEAPPTSKATADESGPVVVDPAVGDPRTTFKARVRNEQNVGPGDNYQFIFKGPGAADCKGTLSWSLGYLPDEPGAAWVRARFYPTRKRSGRPAKPTTWCPGKFRGRVEFRDFDENENITRTTVGQIRFKVRRP